MFKKIRAVPQQNTPLFLKRNGGAGKEKNFFSLPPISQALGSFAEKFLEFGDVAVFGAVSADSADLFAVVVEDENSGDAAACAEVTAEFFVIHLLSLRHFFFFREVDADQFHLLCEAAEVAGGQDIFFKHLTGTAPIGTGEQNQYFFSCRTCFENGMFQSDVPIFCASFPAVYTGREHGAGGGTGR